MSETETMLQKIINSGTKLTPMMEQYYSIKRDYPDIILLFRMGDFYELFFEDAKKASKILNITLTTRGKLGGIPIPMAGIPHHAATTYIDRITNLGLKAAICEQVENPKETKTIVKRAVTQIVSPGMPYDLEKASNLSNHYMSSATFSEGKFYLTAIDYTVGTFIGYKLDSEEELVEQLRLFSPREFITFLGQWNEFPQVEKYLSHANVLKTHLSREYFETKYSSIYIEKIIPYYEHDEVIQENMEIASSIGALAYYISKAQGIENFFHIKPFRMSAQKGRMKVTMTTLLDLEIMPRNRESYKNSLVGFFDRTKTAMGTREIKNLFKTPLADIKEIESRHKLLDFFLEKTDILDKVRSDFSEIRDIERIMAKISGKKATSSDLLGLARSIKTYLETDSVLENLPKDVIPKLDDNQKKILLEIHIDVEKTLNDEIGASLDKGNLIRSGVNHQRDRLAGLSSNWIKELLILESKYRTETNIPKLRIKSNNVNGYFIEVSKSYTSQVPETFNRRQTLTNCERYTTKELSDFEKEVVLSKEKLEQLERSIFNELINSVSCNSKLISTLAQIIAKLDVFQSFSWMAIQENLVRPTINKTKRIINIEQGWHPLVKSAIKEQFIPHDLYLDGEKYFGLITGPNMAGKTTVMREIAIIQLLTQIGSFVPAKKVELSLCDYLFSRIGANDDILHGKSTFMVEMSETAEIIRHATEKSLIILDEVGRGTSTYDGLSIAWALVEYFVKDIKAFTLFATHYHELIDLIKKSRHAKNLTVETKNENGDVQFLYRLLEQGASQSYGIYVAKLAGMPQEILERSQEILDSLEKKNNKKTSQTPNPDIQLSLFDGKRNEPKINPHLEKLEKELKNMDVLNMTPMDAIFKLKELQEST